MRNIQNNESVVLFEQKVHNGESSEQASKEIKRDKIYISNLNKENSRIKQEIRRLEEKRTKAKEEFKKKFEQLQKSQDRLNRPVKINGKNATTFHLRRILLMLEEFGEMNVKKISVEGFMSYDQARDGLDFLNKYGFIQEIRIGDSCHYIKI
jgi:predicted transcriptional regulator